MCAGDAGAAGLGNGSTGDGDQDTTGCDGVPDKRRHLSPHAEEKNRTPFVSTTLGAVTDGEDASVTLRVAHSCDHICLVQLKKKD